MKQSGMTIIFVIVCIAVLIGSWGIGLCIRQVRFRSAGIESKAGTEPEMSAEMQKPEDAGKPESKPAEMTQVRPEAGPMPGGEGRRPFGGLSQEEREKMRERWENMSEEEREQEREKRMAEMSKRREQLENMSEEEREKFRAEMREKFGGRRRQGGRRRPDAGRQENDL
jgi:hypothetical protein